MSSRSWSIERVEGSERDKVASFMATEFSKHYAARICDDTDEVYAVIGPNGQLEAAFGLTRRAERFFSRHYLADDVRSTLASTYGEGARHKRVVELSHLCVRTPRAMCGLLPVVADFLAQQAEYLVCTATRELAAFFSRKGLVSHTLGKASIAQLPEAQRYGWGSYYEHAPVVLSGRLQDASVLLQSEWMPVCEVA